MRCPLLRLTSNNDNESTHRPIKQCPGEVRGFLERAGYMLDIAQESLSDVPLTSTDKPGFHRFIKRVPLGVVLVIAPWKYAPSSSPSHHLLNISKLPLPDLYQLRPPSSHRRERRNPQTIPSNTLDSRTFRLGSPQRRRPTRPHPSHPHVS